MNQEYLKSILKYNPNAGSLFWIIKKSNSIKSGSQAGKIQIGESGKSYKRIKIDSKGYLEHRLIWLYFNESIPSQIDHIDGNGLNNKYENLRAADPSINSRNRRLPKTNKSGVIGISWDIKSSKWVAYINHRNKKLTLGRFADKFEAICSRKSAEIRHGYHYNHGSQRPL